MKNKHLKIAISFILIILSYGFILNKLINYKGIEKFSTALLNLTIQKSYILVLVLVLMIINWSLESIKWKILINRINTISFFTSLKIIFAGISIGIFTPNRVGEIGGRVTFLENGQRTFGALATSMGSYAQFITTMITGLIGSVLFLYLFSQHQINSLINSITISLLFLFIIILIWCFYNFKKITPFLLRFKIFRKKTDQIDYFNNTSQKVLSTILLLSFLRYVVFTSQFYFLLTFFNVDLTVQQAYISISLIYLLATIIPTTTLAELGIRGSLAIFFLSIFSSNIIGIVFSTLLLWIINLALPAIFGSVIFFRKSFD